MEVEITLKNGTIYKLTNSIEIDDIGNKINNKNIKFIKASNPSILINVNEIVTIREVED